MFCREYARARAASCGCPLLCLPGLTRNSRDFDPRRARCNAVSDGCSRADLRGRGRSQYDPNWQNYQPRTYVADSACCCSTPGVSRCVLIGTSLGGILSHADRRAAPAARVAGVVLNDVGPEVAPEGLARIAGYVGRHAPPAQLGRRRRDRARHLRDRACPTSPTRTGSRSRAAAIRDVDGVPLLDMDPMIGDAVRGAPPPRRPTCGRSTRLAPGARRSRCAARRPTSFASRRSRACSAEKPDLEHVVVPRRGHAPTLDEPVAVAAIDAFLARVP